ncbi:MAG: hypothetical protein GTN76_01285 [Candidatus Aenigmarchaeota archaeon]|nr:hypothetical protein [Candidatus Aenigmarchaeota archaeon]
MGSDVYIVGGASTRFTYRPEMEFEEMAYEAVNNALKMTGIPIDKIDSFGLASMVPGGFGKKSGEISIEIAEKVGLNLHNCEIISPVEVTSSSGGEALSRAYNHIAHHPNMEYSLVLGCELMGEDKETIKETLLSAVGKRERKFLRMLDEGDLLMSPLVDWFGLGEGGLSKHILSRISVGKYKRGKNWPEAQYHEDEVDFSKYRKTDRITQLFKIYDVVPTSNGACAILLSKHPPEKPLNDRIVRIRGTGQGVASPSVSDRKGPVDYFQSIRLSYKRACKNAGVSLEYLRKTVAEDFAIIHDAFPSIEIAFLKELGFDKREIVNLLISGKTNPYGGLKVCGHAIGASGVLQAVQAWKKLCEDKGYKRSFTTSVGGPLTNIHTSILEAMDADGEFPQLSEEEMYIENDFLSYLQPDSGYEKILKELNDERGMVIANTMVKDTAYGDVHVNLVQLGPEDRKEIAFSKSKIDLGRYVDIEPFKGEEGIYRVKNLYRRDLKRIITDSQGSLKRLQERGGIKKAAKRAFKESL